MRIDFNGAALAAAVILFSTVSPSIAETPRSTAPLDARSGGTSGAMTQQAAPSRRVGQLSLVLGRVDFRGPDDGQWSPGVLNDPVATGVALRTDPSARLEIRIGPDRLDLASGTEIAIIRLEPGSTEIALRSGRIELDLGRFDPGESVAVDTARGGVWLGGEGRYDVDAGADGHGLRIVVYAGSARFAGGGADLPIAAGNRLTLDGSGPVRSETESASPDAFAQWCARRAVDDASLAAPYFVSREMTGYAALDAGGDWVKNSAYGEVWVPHAPAGDWAPYRNGHWRWLAPWGWSWVDDRPWGFATSHYGRWRVIDGRWAWVPGKFVLDPVWAPALVAFLGTPAVGLSYAGGSGPAIAWFPLAPGEVYWPNYTHYLNYIRAVNRGSVADLSMIRERADGEPAAAIANAAFANREFASVVPRPVFVAGQEVAASLLTIPDQRLRNAPLLMGSPQIGRPAPAPAPIAVAAAAAHPHAAAPKATKTARRAGWMALVRAAAIRARNFQEAAREHFVRLRITSGGEIARLRHTIVLRVARAEHSAAGVTRRRLIRR